MLTKSLVVPDNRNSLIQTVIDILFPIGAIYTTTNLDFNPEEAFGGKWKQLNDVFLLSAGKKAVKTTGGSETVTLTIDQMPKHSHDAPQANSKVDDYVFQVSRNNVIDCTGRRNLAIDKTSTVVANTTDTSVTDSIGADDIQAHGGCKSTKTVGNGSSHNNMPPYYTVLMFERIE